MIKCLVKLLYLSHTEYGLILNEAIRSYYHGDEEKATELFNRVVNMNANLNMHMEGWKSLLRSGNYEMAVKYFKESIDRKNYSKAFILFRRENMREIFPVLTQLYVYSRVFPLIRKFLISRIRRITFFKKRCY